MIGVGGMGSAVLCHLARRGLRVLGIERFDIAHDRGSSHGQTRIIRKAYFEHPDYVPLLQRIYEMWAELEAETEKRLVQRVGLFIAGRPEGEYIANVKLAAAEHHLDIECLDAAEARIRFTGFVFPDEMEVLFEADAGFLRVEECVRAHVERAVAHGASIHTGEKVEQWSTDGETATVVTDRGRYTAANVVFCGGAWTRRLIRSPNLPLTVLRKMQLWFAPTSQDYRADSGCPVFAYHTGDGFFYGFPVSDDGLMKIAEHTGEQTVPDPDTMDRDVQPADTDRVRRFIAAHLPGVDPQPRRHSVCMYTMTPDEHFIIDRLPGTANAYLAAGFSGHGFKFAPIVGKVLADLIIDGKTNEPVGFLSASRATLTV